MEGSSPARLYSMLVGGVLVIAGVIGFFYASGFDTGDSICAGDGCDKVFGLLGVNGWHNLVHILTGALGLLLAGYAARQYALGLGVVYLAIAIWGFILGSGSAILDIVPVNTEDNFLHLILGLLGIAAGLATPAPRNARRPPQPAT